MPQFATAAIFDRRAFCVFFGRATLWPVSPYFTVLCVRVANEPFSLARGLRVLTEKTMKKPFGASVLSGDCRLAGLPHNCEANVNLSYIASSKSAASRAARIAA